MNEYQGMKHDYRGLFDRMGNSASLFIFDDSGPAIKHNCVSAVRNCIALARLEIEHTGELQDITNYMFVKNFDLAPFLNPEEFPILQEEIDEILEDIKYVLDSGKVRFKDVDIGEDDILTEEYLEYYRKSDKQSVFLLLKLGRYYGIKRYS